MVRRVAHPAHAILDASGRAIRTYTIQPDVAFAGGVPIVSEALLRLDGPFAAGLAATWHNNKEAESAVLAQTQAVCALIRAPDQPDKLRLLQELLGQCAWDPTGRDDSSITPIHETLKTATMPVQEKIDFLGVLAAADDYFLEHVAADTLANILYNRHLRGKIIGEPSLETVLNEKILLGFAPDLKPPPISGSGPLADVRQYDLFGDSDDDEHKPNPGLDSLMSDAPCTSGGAASSSGVQTEPTLPLQSDNEAHRDLRPRRK